MPMAVTLKCYGFALDCVDKSNPQKAVFVFNRKDGLDKLIQGFWAHELLVDPLLYNQYQKEVKSRLYE